MDSACFNPSSIQYYSQECVAERNQTFDKISKLYEGRNRSSYVDIKYASILPDEFKLPTTQIFPGLLAEKNFEDSFSFGAFYGSRSIVSSVSSASLGGAIITGIFVASIPFLFMMANDPCSIDYDWSNAHMYNPSLMTNGVSDFYKCNRY